MLIKANGIQVDYRDAGAGIPVIFIHAFPLNQTMWEEQWVALQNYCRAITLDLRGFGESDAPLGPYLMDQMAADVRGLMSVLGIERAVLVGLSMGGYVTLAFYRNYPDLVHALVLADTRASADTPEARERRFIFADKAERDGARAIAEEMIPLLLGQTTLANKPSIAERVVAMIERNSALAIASAQRGMAERPDSSGILGAINVPALILVGSEDSLTRVTECEELCSRIRGARLRVLERAGHLSNLEASDQFNSALIEFIQSLEDAPK